MSRRHQNLTRHNVLLNRGDFSWLQDTYPGLGAAAIIRTLIERHRREVEEQVDQKAPVDALSISHKKALA